MNPTVHPDADVTFLRDVRFTPPLLDGEWVATQGYVFIHACPGDHPQALINVTYHQQVPDLLALIRDADAVGDAQRTTVDHRGWTTTGWLQDVGVPPMEEAPDRVRAAFDRAVPQHVWELLTQGGAYREAITGEPVAA